ncbi:hypothetical protein [Methanoculleus sp.]|jgi:hypothetical protein|uniref:hypothetical protein n=1 Tax=Methanoculleus sp. TaxID=90427 RepID=UPI001BD66D68|nr:hypothetical protein [Methanoculleus sp.]
MKIQSLERLADIFPYLTLSFYIVGCIFCVYIDRMSYLVNGSIIAIPAIIACAVFILIKKKDPDLSGKAAVFRYSLLVSPAFFLLYSTLAVLTLLVTEIDFELGLFPVLILYTTIFIQILSWRLRPATVLLEIMLTLAITIYSYTLRPALYFGTTDILSHSYMATVTYLSGHVIPADLGTYTYFPLYHIFVAQSSQMLGMDLQTSLFVTTGLIFASTVLFLYYLVNSIFRNEQIALLAVLLYAMNADVIFYGTYMVTRIMAYVGFLVLLYLLYTMTSPKADTEHAIARPVARKIPAVIMTVFILLTHQISMPMIIILIGLLFILEWVVQERKYVSPVFLMVPISLFACYWTFIAYPFVKELLPRTELSLYQEIVFTDVVYNGWNFLVSQIDGLFVVFFALIGAIYLIWKQQPKYSAVFGLLGLVAILLNVPNILTVIFQFAAILRIDRFAILFLPILAVVMGVGIYLLTRHLSAVRPSSKWVGVVLVALVFLYGIGSLGLVKDEPSYKRYSFDQDEVAGFDRVLKTVPSGSSLYSDYYTLRFFGRKKINESENLKLPYYTTRMMPNNLKISGRMGYIILLNAQFMHGGLLVGAEELLNEAEIDPDKSLRPYRPTEENVLNMTGRLSAEDKIYSNSAVEVYHFLH